MTVQEAVQKAFDHVRSLFSGQDIRNLLLEEVEKQGPEWRITISFSRPDTSNVISGVFSSEYVREYKIMTLDGNGNLVSMKIRKS